MFNTYERGIDHFFDKRAPGQEIRVIRAEISQIGPDASINKFLPNWGLDLAKECDQTGPTCLVTFFGKKVAKILFHSLLGDSGAYYIYPGMKNWRDSTNQRMEVEWKNTCIGPYGDKPIRYFFQFILSGPKHLLYPRK